MELRVRNVQEAYVEGLAALRELGVWEDTRNGRALVLPWPMITVYERPIERVLLDPVRDANPFFHLMEAIWMLAGRSDVASLLPFNKALAQYSDDGETYHGGYGARWRNWFTSLDEEFTSPLDQVRRVIELLRTNPADRRCVIQMWDAETDLGRDGRDFPCNTQLFFRARRVEAATGFSERTADGVDITPVGGARVAEHHLDMTILNRSNDAVWGAYGANAVHFSVLQEFIAAACGMQTGRMIQFSNNFHAYEAVLDKVGEPKHHFDPRDYPGHGVACTAYDTPTHDRVGATPLFRVDGTTDLDDVFRVIDDVWDKDVNQRQPAWGQFTEQGLNTIDAVRDAYQMRRDEPEGARLLLGIAGPDWRRACIEWLDRRRKN